MRPPDWQSDDGAIRLYCGDCLELLPMLEGVGCVATDPPYGIRLRNGDVDGHRSDRWNTIAGDDNGTLGESAIQWGRDNNLPIVAFASPWKPWPGEWRNLIVWDKGGAVGGGGDIRTCLKRSWELIQVANNGPMNGPRCESVWMYPMVPSDTADHIAAKPLPLMVELIERFSNCEDLICDPFFGSGTTAIACVQTGRRFIGMELEPRYFDIAVKRIEAAIEQHAGGPMFKHIPDQPLFEVTA